MKDSKEIGNKIDLLSEMMIEFFAPGLEELRQELPVKDEIEYIGRIPGLDVCLFGPVGGDTEEEL